LEQAVGPLPGRFGVLVLYVDIAVPALGDLTSQVLRQILESLLVVFILAKTNINVVGGVSPLDFTALDLRLDPSNTFISQKRLDGGMIPRGITKPDRPREGIANGKLSEKVGQQIVVAGQIGGKQKQNWTNFARRL
jgi:hypothetical protein